jgi:two-component system sensor histidine kinase DegS
MRELIFELGRGPTDDGLVTALAKHAASLSDRDGLEIAVDGPSARPMLSAAAETQLYAIGREALANVVRHAGAKTAMVRVEVGPERVVVEIADDGCGFDPAAVGPGHFGLDSMRSRAAEVGGALTIDSAPGCGTVVRIEAQAQSGVASDGD